MVTYQSDVIAVILSVQKLWIKQKDRVEDKGSVLAIPSWTLFAGL